MPASVEAPSQDQLDLDRDGALYLPGLAKDLGDALIDALSDRPDGQAGLRVTGAPSLRALLDLPGSIDSAVAAHMGRSCRPVRAILFDKSDATNWALGWHQDRTIAVRGRLDVPDFGPWTMKQGIQHVEPPFGIIDAMMTLRLHLDPVDAENAPLLVALGSHKLGRVPATQVEPCVANSTILSCLADAGDGWLYHTPILHASARAMGAGRRRRVLQVDYAWQHLPAGLEWLGI